MTRLSLKSLLIIVVLLLVGITALWQIQRRASPAAAWFSDAWQYRKAINIGYTGATALTDFQVSVDIGTSALIAAGKMKSDCSDIRFTDQNGNLLNYWIEENNPGCNQLTDTKIWLKIPRINTTGTNIYLYYGNSSATSFQDGNKVFEFFDDFDDGSISDWTETGTGTTNTVSTDYSVSPSYSLRHKYTSAYGTVYKTYPNQTSTFIAEYSTLATADNSGLNFDDGTTFGNYNGSWVCFRNGNLIYYADIGDTILQSRSYNQWYKVKLIINPQSQNIKVYIDNSNALYDGDMRGNITTFNKVHPAVYTASFDTYFDNVRIRKYAPSDPTKTLLDEERSIAPIAHWSFDEGVGTSAFDSSSNRNNGAITGATWLTDDMCITGKCLKFSTASNYVSMSTSAPELGTSNFTISVWAYFGDSTYQWQRLAGKKAQAAAAAGYSIYYGGDTGKLMWSTANGSTANEYWTTATFTRNTWHHIVMVRNSSDSRVGYFYVDGKRYEITNIPSVLDISSPSQNFTVGAMTNGALQFKGYIDEPKVYAYARTAAQIKQDYRAGLSGMKSAKGANVAVGGKSGKDLSDGLILYWKFDEGIGTSVADSSGVGNSGVGNSTPAWTSGKYGIGISFGGNTTYITAGKTLPSTVSISTWATYSGDGMMWNRQSGAGPDLWFNGGNIYLNTWDGNANPLCAIPSDANNGQFHHYVLINTSPTASLYYDGRLCGTAGYRNPAGNFIVSSGETSSYGWKGKIDEVRVYNRAISIEEVKKLYEYAPGPVAYYDFEEGVGSTAFDRSGNNNNAVLSVATTVPQWKTGKIGKSLQFLPKEYIQSNNFLNFNNDFTVNFWTKGADNSDWRWFLNMNNDGTGTTGAISIATHGDRVRWSYGAWFTNAVTATTTVLNDTSWYYITVGKKGNQTFTYINGIPEGVGTTTSVSNMSLIAPIYIGCGPNQNGAFNSLIDEVKIYNYARTQKQILQDMNASDLVGGMSKINKPIAWYKFDEGQGTVANNSGSIGSTINGTFGPGYSAPTWVAGKSGKGLSFDGNDYLNTVSQLADTEEISISSWVYVDSSCPNYGSTRLIHTMPLCNADQCGFDYKAGTGDKFEFVLRHDNDTETYDSITIPLNTWNHLVAVFNGTQIKLYKNGILSSTKTTNGTGIDFGNRTIYMSGNSASRFVGKLDEVKIYNYALSEDEIKQDYNQGATAVIGKSTQTIGTTTTSLDYCIPGDTSHCAAPIAEYNFEEGVGTTAYDKSGNGKHGVWQGTLGSQWKAGKIGSAGNFNGTDNYTEIATGHGLLNTDITASMWVYPTSWANQPHVSLLNSRSGSYNGFMFFIYNQTYLNFDWGDGSASNRWDTGYQPPLNTWTYLTITRNSSGRTLYVNGKYQNSTAVAGGPPTANTIFRIGADTVSNQYFYQGKIDNVKVYNYARTPAQIAYDYNKGAPIAHWKMDECQGTTINDSSGNNNHGTLTIGVGGSQSSVGTCQSSGAWYNGRTGKINSAMSFDGTDDYINIDSSLNTIKSLTTGSISFWFNKQSSERDALFFFGQASTTDYFSILHDDQNKIEYTVWQAGQNVLLGKTNNAFTDWTHVVIVISNSGNTFFVNGKQQAVTYIAGNSSSTNFFATQTNPTIVSLAKRNLNTFENWLTGKLDDVRIYNYALTSEQVKQVYSGGAMNFR